MAAKKFGGEGVLVVRYKVIYGKINEFETWKSSIDKLLGAFVGFINLSVLYPAKNSDFYYIILRFDTKGHAATWMHSKEREEMLEKSLTNWMTDRQEVIHEWDMFWYSTFRRTKKWKQWAVTFIAVYPLTIAIPILVGTFSALIPLQFLEGIIRALLISGFMTFLIMPFVSRVFRKWLHN